MTHKHVLCSVAETAILMRNTTFLNRLHIRNSVRIIEVSDNRGTDNRGRTVSPLQGCTQGRGGNIPWNIAHISTIVLLHCHFNISTAGVYPGKGRESTQGRGGKGPTRGEGTYPGTKHTYLQLYCSIVTSISPLQGCTQGRGGKVPRRGEGIYPGT